MTVDVKQVYNEVASDEGKILHCYLCSELHKTVGIGHKVLETDTENNLSIYEAYDNKVPEDQKISEGRCYELFQEDIQIALGGCQKIYSNWEDLPQEVQQRIEMSRLRALEKKHKQEKESKPLQPVYW